MTRRALWVAAAAGLLLILGIGTARAEEANCRIDSSTSVTPAQCLEHLNQTCDEVYEEVLRGCQAKMTKPCSKGCCRLAAEAQRLVCRADACIGAIDGCSHTNLCSCAGTFPIPACQRDWLCRDAVMSECWKECKRTSWDSEPTYRPDFRCGGIRTTERIDSCLDLRETVPDWARPTVEEPEPEAPPASEATCPEACPAEAPFCTAVGSPPRWQCSRWPRPLCPEACPEGTFCAQIGADWACQADPGPACAEACPESEPYCVEIDGFPQCSSTLFPAPVGP